jgi:hypothetical protein
MSEPVAVSGKKLLVSTGIAAAVASVVLVAAVLPAEYGIDPLGIGSALGIKNLSAVENADDSQSSDASAVSSAVPTEVGTAPMQSETAAESSTVWKSAAAYRSDELSLTLAPNEGAEIKALMRVGERLFFSWEATGLVNFDMHGEVADAKSNDFTSYWKGRQEQSGHGAFTAPFDGTHGWYWRNRGTKPVTVTVKTSGFYEKLYKP